MSDVRINTRSPYYIEANATEPTQPVIPPPVGNEPPTVYIQVSNDNPYLGEVVTLTAVATDVDGTIVSYFWGGFGSGTTESITATNSSIIQDQVFIVTVTDNDGNTATAIKTISWRDEPEQIVNQDIDVNCGDVINEGSFIGTKTYNLVGVADKIGDVEIEFLNGGGQQNIPVKFTMVWNGVSATTGFIGESSYINPATFPYTDNTGFPTTKAPPTKLILNKTAASPETITLTAEVWNPNDSYTFRLNCPDVQAVETFYYTLINECEDGEAEFTYTDVNGVLQTVTVATTLTVSAQTGTPLLTYCDGTIEQGGESFDLGTPELTIDSNTQFTFYLDKSGSLGGLNKGEIKDLVEMTENQLKASFLTYYNNNSVTYNQRVRYILPANERFLEWASQPAPYFPTASTKACNLIYVDEADFVYHGKVVGNNTKTSYYSEDLLALRNRINSVSNYGDHIVVVFCIEKQDDLQYIQFSHFIDNISTGANGFFGSNGLSDRSEVIFVRNVLPKQNSDYYHQVTIDALTSLGFKI